MKIHLSFLLTVIIYYTKYNILLTNIFNHIKIGLKKVFNNDYKFKTKIFINKIGPSFGSKLNVKKIMALKEKEEKSKNLEQENDKLLSKLRGKLLLIII